MVVTKDTIIDEILKADQDTAWAARLPAGKLWSRPVMCTAPTWTIWWRS